MTRRTKASLLTIAALVALGACSQSRKTIAVAQGDYRDIRVQEVTAELKLSPGGQSDSLGEAERLAVDYFASAYRAEGNGPIVIAYPGSSPWQSATEARAVLLAAGISPSGVVDAPGQPSGGSEPLVLSYRTYETTVQDCPTINEIKFESTRTNTVNRSFGCSVSINLAAMIADPSDLVGVQPMDPSDATRRAIVFEKYRNGEPTAAEREASGAISQAIGN